MAAILGSVVVSVLLIPQMKGSKNRTGASVLSLSIMRHTNYAGESLWLLFINKEM